MISDYLTPKSEEEIQICKQNYIEELCKTLHASKDIIEYLTNEGFMHKYHSRLNIHYFNNKKYSNVVIFEQEYSLKDIESKINMIKKYHKIK